MQVLKVNFYFRCIVLTHVEDFPYLLTSCLKDAMVGPCFHRAASRRRLP